MIHADNIIHVTQIIDAGPAGSQTTEELVQRIIADLRSTIGTLKCAMSERLVRLGISMAQLNIMYTLQRVGAMTMSHLADVLGVSLSNATGLVDRMEERGFIERSRVPEDRRVVIVRITEAGARMLDENEALHDALMRSVLARLDAAELPAIAHAVAEVRSALDAAPLQPLPGRHAASASEPRSS